MNSPCLGCLERKAGCHSICAKYLTFDAQQKKQRAERLLDNGVLDLECSRSSRWKQAAKNASNRRSRDAVKGARQG